MTGWTRLLRSRLRPLRWPGRWPFLVAAGGALGVALGLALFVTLVDPHDLYPWGARPHLSGKTLAGSAQTQVLNVATNGDFDAILIGSSSAQQFEGPDLARHLSGVKRGYAIVYLGAQPKDQAVVMDRVARAPNLKRVLLSYDLGYLAPAQRMQPNFPNALYDDTPLNDLGAMTPTSLSLAWRLATGQSYDDRQWDIAPLRAAWARRHRVSQTPRVVGRYKSFMAQQKPRLDAPTSLTCADFEANAQIADFARRLQARGVRLDIIIPPYSYAAYSDFNRPERNARVQGQPAMAAFLQSRRCMIAAVSPYANTRVYGFDLERDLVEDMGNYFDTTHLYGSVAGRRMLEAIGRGENVLTVETFEPYAQEMRRRVVAWEYHNSKAKP
ncbi:hypothetical protein GVN21_18715 [Caulobacter sp. SLTY]|uniref:hypothetical protein n=1 Tax=Caulobacter sp. SLTY TaxID=2683262 RepID=UPI0014135DAC|nr:hypothetical protein [Caulobacter sp. SLTY]NBB17399.1 hypothetical protein [Caulobacter sp. SLTY]